MVPEVEDASPSRVSKLFDSRVKCWSVMTETTVERYLDLAGCGKRHVKARHWSRFHRFQTMPTVILAGTLPKAGRVWPFWAL
ncbi:hypothetical protein [Novosphingobium pituita]|uniref:hypothetical protein n=1 Tax=Novosphingobium pituita TaxID=3056842 RepID=UPI00295F426C|nr:hypothetical protein [Novosphingobium sp. IK01]